MRLFRDTASYSDTIDLPMEALFGPKRPEKGATEIRIYLFLTKTRPTVRSFAICSSCTHGQYAIDFYLTGDLYSYGNLLHVLTLQSW